MTFHDLLVSFQLHKGSHVIVHSSFSKIKNTLNNVTAQNVIDDLKKNITAQGSLIMPSFTYCWKKKDGSHNKFDRINSPSLVSYLSEEFRKSKGVVRTNSPTHSFSVWGKASIYFDEKNSPVSPLGKGSILEWLTLTPNSFILMLGTDFRANTYCHYLEIKAKVPWYNFSPWGHMGVENVGVSVKGEQNLTEVPGCSGGFINFENYLLENNIIKKNIYKNLQVFLIPIESIYKHGLIFFSNSYDKLLCEKDICKACDSRREVFLNK